MFCPSALFRLRRDARSDQLVTALYVADESAPSFGSVSTVHAVSF
jgi:hypothetical protein